MTKRFRMIAGPNGSGKSTLVGLLRRDYAVNFYTMLNADEIFAEVSKTRAYLPALPVGSLTDKLLAKRAHRKWEKLLPGDGILSSVKD